MDESSSLELLSAQSHNNNNNNNNDQKSENVDDKNANPIDLNVQNNSQNSLLDIDSSDFDYDSLDGDQNEIENMLIQAMDSNASENSTNPDVLCSHNNTIDANDFKNSADNNNIPTTSNENCHSNEIENNIKQIEQQTNDTEPKPADNHIQDNNESNNVSIIDVNNEHYESAEEGEPIFDFLGKANEIVCYVFYFNTLVHFTSCWFFFISTLI